MPASPTPKKKPRSPTKKGGKRPRKKKAKYKVRNWREYNEMLVRRGSLMLWIYDEDLKKWRQAVENKQQGAQRIYSDMAIQCLLTLREVFHLNLRGTEGLARSIFFLMKISLPVPDFSTLSRRAVNLPVVLPKRTGGQIHLVLDSTGLKVFGEGEWKVRKHGWGTHRTWRKLHLAVNPDTHDIEASVLTGNDSHDSQQVKPLLDQIDTPIEWAAMDGAYDQWNVYEELQKRGIEGCIPPQHNARIKKHGLCHGPPLPRDEAIRAIRSVGRRRWKENTNYHRRSLSETAMFRMKTIFGDHLKSRNFDRQQTEAMIRCRALNRITQLGMPDSVKVA